MGPEWFDGWVKPAHAASLPGMVDTKMKGVRDSTPSLFITPDGPGIQAVALEPLPDFD
jgi:hypothetical protein